MTGFHSAAGVEAAAGAVVGELELVVVEIAESTSDPVVEVLADGLDQVVVGAVVAAAVAAVAAPGSSPPWLTTTGAPAPQPPMSRPSTTAPITARIRRLTFAMSVESLGPTV